VSLDAIIGRSESILSLKRLIESVAQSDATVLVIGESGTGKELVARALHDHSQRASKRFVPVNCGAIPKDLIESELFGHRKGAFTGAISDRMGRFELAQDGTLFLDEIGDLPLDMQVKLLRVLQERTVDPIGSNKPVDINVRVVAATHKDLESEVQAGRFREDLYYRLNVLPVTTPPLRERPEDIAALCEHFAKIHANPNKLPVELSDLLLSELLQYEWPGNIRELSNLIARFSVLFPGKSICYADIPSMMMPKGLRERRSPSALTEVGNQNHSASMEKAKLVSQSPVASPDESKVVSLEAQSSETPLATEPSVVAGDPLKAKAPRASENPAEGFEPESAADALSPAISAGSAGPESPNTSSPSQASSGDYNPIEDLIALAQGTPLPAIDSIPLKQRIAELEKTLIEQALQQAEGNVSQTARILAIQRTTLIEKINKYNLKAQADEASTA
jgi:sigma-54 specific flagellar transcriptional regulator A